MRSHKEVINMALPVGSVARIIAKMLAPDNSLIQNTFFFENSGSAPIDGDVLTTFIEAAMGTFYNYLSSSMPTDIVPVEVELDEVLFVDGKLVTLSPIGTLPWTTFDGGASASDRYPNYVTGVVHFPTTIPRVSGRKSLGPLTKVAGSGDLCTSTFILDMSYFAVDIVLEQTVDGQAARFGIMSSKVQGFLPYGNFVINAVLGHQNTRKTGVGQ
jgi:hypothetical protein